MKNNHIKYIELGKNFKKIKSKLIVELTKIGEKGDFILGSKVKKFENELKKFTQSDYVATCGNGTDAIEIALKILNVKDKDEVITASNTWLSVGNAILNVGARPKFVDINNSLNIDSNKIENVISKKTKCIIVTHLNGLPCDINKICKIAKKYKIKVIEDCSQAIGSLYNEIHVGNFGDIATYSLHPTKNLGVFGDGGFIATNNKKYFKKILNIRNNGLINRDISNYNGRNSRLDNFQAIVGLLQLKNIKKHISLRQRNAAYYNKHLAPIKKITHTPSNFILNNKFHTYHRYVLICEQRNKLLSFLIKNRIDAKIHYPINIHEQLHFKKFYKNNLQITNDLNKKIISLPVHENLNLQELDKVIFYIKKYYNK
jgi:dTDP-4-amino-4,6-dideoxygalactose transaminase